MDARDVQGVSFYEHFRCISFVSGSSAGNEASASCDLEDTVGLDLFISTRSMELVDLVAWVEEVV